MNRLPSSQRILKDSTEALVLYPQEPIAPSGTPTVRIRTPSTPQPDVGENATLEAVSSTLSAAAAQGARSLSIASAAIVLGHRYILEDATSGRRVFVTAAKGGTLTTLPIAEPLPRAFATSSTLKGCCITHALLAAETEQTGRGHVEVTATLDGVAEVWEVDFWIVPRSNDYRLDGEYLGRMSPYCAGLRPADDDDFSRTIDAAWRRLLEPALNLQGIRPEMIIGWGVIDPLHVLACEHFLAEQYEDDAEIRKERKVAFVEALRQALQNPEVWVASGDTVDDPAPDAARGWGVVEVER